MKFLHVNDDQELVFSEIEQPTPTDDECLIKVKAIGINRADLLQKAGKYPAPEGDSDILGLEICGEIVHCGKNVQHWQKGQHILGLVGGGGYAEYAVIKAEHMIKLPSNLSVEQGAAIAETFLTAYQSLFTIAQLQNKQNVLIHAGASGIGTSAIQLAKAKGCYVVVTVSSDEKAKACLDLGADVALNYNEVDFVAWSKENLKSGFNMILDVVAGDYLTRNVNICALDAHIVVLAMLGGRFSQPVDFAKMLGKRITISASTLRNRSQLYKTQLVKDFVREFNSSIEEEVIYPVVDSVSSWKQANEAHQLMESNTNIGKMILKTD